MSPEIPVDRQDGEVALKKLRDRMEESALYEIETEEMGKQANRLAILLLKIVGALVLLTVVLIFGIGTWLWLHR